MYDNMIIKADLQSINKTAFFVQAQSFPNAIIEDTDGVASKVIFYWRNLLVKVTAETVVIKGSICKYHLVTNQYTLTRQTTEEAFKQLAEDLQLPFHLFDVMYFEFESNLIMDHDVQYYYAFFGDCKGFKVKSTIGKTLFYENTYRRVSFYDKIDQINSLKREPVKVIKEFEDKNVLRFGIRYQKTVCKKLNRASLTVADLHSKEFYSTVVNKWREEYFNITKFMVKTFDDIVFTGKASHMLDQYTILGILGNGGQAEALERVKRADKQNVFKFSANKKRCIDAINDLCNSESLFKEDKGIEELNRKINEEAERHLAM